MNRRQKIIVSITGIFLVLLILVGLTYAYFLTKIQGNTNEKSISATTANLSVIYKDGDNQILTKNNITPGMEVGTKSFSVENDGDAETYYVVVLDNVTVTSKDGASTTFKSNDFVYTLTCTSNKSNKTCEGETEETTLPIMSGGKVINNGVLIGNKIAVGETQNYELTVKYIDTGIDQSADMGKTLGAKIDIKNAKEVNPYSGNSKSLAYNIIDNAATNKNGTELKIVSLSGPGKMTSSWVLDDFDIQEKDVSNAVPGFEDYSIWRIADSYEEAMANGVSGPSAESWEDAVGKWVYDTSRYETVYKVLGYDSSSQIVTLGYPKMTYGYETELSVSTDDYGTSYYYRGDVKDNYVEFAGMCWRIVRIQGDGSIKLVLASESTCSASNINSESGFATENGKVLEVTYGYKTIQGDNFDIHLSDYINSESDTKNNAKTKLESWRDSKIGSENVNKLKTEDWCIGDLKNIYSNGKIVGSVDSEVERFKSLQMPGMVSRFDYAAGDRYDREKPDMKCVTSGATGEIDKNTVGMLTMDEVAFAGGVMSNSLSEDAGSKYYLDDESASTSWWTLTPGKFSDVIDSPDDWICNVAGGALGTYVSQVSGTRAIRPSVVLNVGAEISSGDGTLENPYKIK